MRRVDVYLPSRQDRPLEQHANVRSLRLQASPDVTVVKIIPETARRPPAQRAHG